MTKANAELRNKLNNATSKASHSTIVQSNLGSALRVRCFHDANAAATDPSVTGVEFLNCAMAGPLTVDPATGDITDLGALSDVTLHTFVNLATGAAVLRIEDGTDGDYLQYTLGLSGSGKEFTVPANIAVGSGFAFSPAARLKPPASLPLGGPTPVGNTITSVILQNLSSSTVGSHFIPPMFGHPFKQGDIPAGHYPLFELTDGTYVPCTMFDVATWDDGSILHASFVVRVPTTASASSTVTVNIKATTTAPGASSRTLADLSSNNTDLQVVVTGLDNLTGEWVSRLNQGILDGDDIEERGDGPVGKVWKIRQQFVQNGANHGQLECYWYVAALQNAGNNLYGLRYLGRVVQPWYDVNTPAKSYRSFSSFLLKNGAATVRDCWAARAGVQRPFRYPTTLTSISDLPTRAKYLEATAPVNMEEQTLVRLVGTTLPDGVNANTSYFITATRYPNHIGLHTDCNLGTSLMPTLSGASSSDCAIVAYPYLTHFGSLYTAGASATWDFVQAGGSESQDAPIRVIHNSAYWQSTGVVPAFENISVSNQTEYGYELNSMTPITRVTTTTGERADIGVMPDWYVRHLLSQRAVDEKVVRALGLKHAHAAIALYESASRSIKPINGGTYTGMPASSTTFCWTGESAATSGFTGPTSNTKTGLTALKFDHMPSLSAYPYLLTGEPQYLDTLVEMAHMAVIAGISTPSVATANNAVAERNITIAGTTYYGVVAFNNQPRTAAWSLREIGFAAALLPDNHKFKQYFVDLNAANYTAMKAFHDNLATDFWKSSGLLSYSYDAVMSPWMISYMGQSIAQTYRMTRDSNALFMLNHLVKWWDSVYTAHGSWHVSSYRQLARLATNGGAVITSMDQVAYGIETVSWSSATNLVTITPNATDGYTPQNGDVLMWDRNSSGTGFGEGAAPAGLNPCTQYYLLNKSGNTYQLSDTPGGTPITFTDSRSTNTYVRMAAPPSNNTIGGGLYASANVSNMRGMLKTAKAAGAAVNQALLDELDTKLAAVSYSSDPRYHFADSY